MGRAVLASVRIHIVMNGGVSDAEYGDLSPMFSGFQPRRLNESGVSIIHTELRIGSVAFSGVLLQYFLLEYRFSACPSELCGPRWKLRRYPDDSVVGHLCLSELDSCVDVLRSR